MKNALPRKSPTAFDSFHRSSMRTAVESGTCKVILGMQVERQWGIKTAVFTLEGFFPLSKTYQ